MIRWPWISRALHDLAIKNLEERVLAKCDHLDWALNRERYWRERCERLTDEALFKAGAIASPAMVERKDVPNVAALVSSAMGMKEFESAPRVGPSNGTDGVPFR